MNALSSEARFKRLQVLYTLGLVITLGMVTGDTYGDPHRRQMTLVLSPVLLTGLLFVGTLLVARREEELSRTERRPSVRPSSAWVTVLVIYMFFAAVIWLWSGFASSYTP